MDHATKVTLDGTDCRVREPASFNTKWYSHKFRGPGISVSGHIVWVSGPYPCGEYPDLKIAREGIIHFLEEGEVLIADGGYKGEEKIWHKGHKKSSARIEGVARVGHETVNGRLKNFNILEQRFRHDLSFHGRCFYAVANLVQLDLIHEQPLFKVEYNE